MTQQILDTLGGELRAVLKKKGITKFAIESAYAAAEELRGDRQEKLAASASKEVAQGQAYDLLLLFDVVAATASIEASSVGGEKDSVPVASEVIDLWIQATAGKSVWFERFVQWPQENPAKKLEYLIDTARKLGAESIARALLEGVQPVKFTEFVGRFSRA
mgnify:CR=1 FL=1